MRSFRPSTILNSFPIVLLVLAGQGCMMTGSTGAPAEINAPFRNASLNLSQWSHRFEGESREVYRERLKIVGAMDIPQGGTVADIGTGTGLFVAYFSQAVGPEGRVLALDIAPDFVGHVSKRAAEAGLTNVEARVSMQDNVGIDSGTVDVAYVCDTYHHFENTARILKSILKALKPGGRFIVVDYHRIAGKSRPFIMDHVRAPKEVFASEIESAGFVRLPDPPAAFLEENYMMVFERKR
ncbi:MAG: ubiquinone/menaquinone biosynthesis C-methylase UbiE [Myxococcota bacterium]|jgi:ubiquinone/menaquinone biosynthesis C-methylase UbiE